MKTMTIDTANFGKREIPIVEKDTFEIAIPKEFRRFMKQKKNIEPDRLTIISTKYGASLVMHYEGWEIVYHVNRWIGENTNGCC